ncbi:hypothetical protein KI387_015886 [Taxus chinensis]|uniref:FAD/NAD(P)-binding domain-containing protein n=1 Tax=Taxus chinensis TaxID=29808 RepID=A0AA38LHL2_TAXCH|nr:hypothetical protein KI387_015886 [Taxus chinensis]
MATVFAAAPRASCSVLVRPETHSVPNNICSCSFPSHPSIKLNSTGACSALFIQRERFRSGRATRRKAFVMPCLVRAVAASEELQKEPVPLKGVENLAIIGSGPAGYTAAIYAARANLKPVVFEGYQVGGVPGGQLMTTTDVENFPGFPDGITGPDLMDRMQRQAERWGAELFHEDVDYIDVRSRPFTIRSSEREVKCHSLIVATGATARRLGLPHEQEFWSRGISACAICDGASPLFKGQELAVVAPFPRPWPKGQCVP